MPNPRDVTQFAYKTISGDALFVVITLDRPEKRNALNNELIDSIVTRMEQVAGHSFVHAIILTGAGDTFCAGADLVELRKTIPLDGFGGIEEVGSVVADWGRLFEAIRQSPIPTIAAVQGAALGGGAALASVCDYVVIHREAVMGYPETTRGIVPALASVYLLQQIGERQAARLLIGGEVVGAEEAVRIGLATFISDDPMQYAEELARKLTQCGPKAVAETKKLIRNRPSLREAGHIAFRHLISGEASEGIASFVEDRKPNWEE